MSNSVVPAASAAHAKQLVQNKKLIKRAQDQQPVRDEAQAADHNPDAAHAVQAEQAKDSMSATSMSGFSFSGALSAAAGSAALAQSGSESDGGSVSDGDGGVSGTVLLVGAVGLAGLGVAVLAGGGGGKKNGAPDITSASTATVAENTPIATAVYTTVATDPDGDTLSYSLSGADAALFNISAAGVVTLKAAADFETKSSYSFNVVASDGELTDTQAVTLTVTDVVENPAFTSGTTATIAENAAITTTVYDANVSGTAPATFALTGADATLFDINTTTGVVTLKNSANFESKASYAIGVIATQGALSSTQSVAVTVTNVVEAPTFTSGTAATTAENVPTTTVIYNADVSGAAATTFSLTGSDAQFFTIDADDGEVRFVNTPNFEARSSYSLSVVASSGGESTTQTVAITVTDVDPEGPTFTSGTTGTIVEEVPTTTVAYDADVSDNTGVVFALAGTDAALFNINAATGQVTFKDSPDYETDPHSYAISVTATNAQGTSTQNVTISVTDAVEQPTVSLDVGSTTTAITLTDAANGATVFTDDFDLTTNVILKGFTEDDVIEVSNGLLTQYSFTTGTGTGGADDLVITFNDLTASGVTGRIVIEDVVEGSPFFSTYAGAAASVGYDFMVIA